MNLSTTSWEGTLTDTCAATPAHGVDGARESGEGVDGEIQSTAWATTATAAAFGSTMPRRASDVDEYMP